MVRPGEHIPDVLSEDEGNALLEKDILKSERSVDRLISVPLNSNQYSALVSFTFNLGSGALQRSTLRRKLNRADFQEVPLELRRWVYAGGRILNGLIRRRLAEGDLFIR